MYIILYLYRVYGERYKWETNICCESQKYTNRYPRRYGILSIPSTLFPSPVHSILFHPPFLSVFFFLHEWADTHIFSYFLSYVKDSILSIFFCIFTSSVTICLQKSYHTFIHRAPPHWPSTVCLYHSSFQYPLIPICFLSFVTFKMLSWITMCILRFGEVYLQGKFLDMRLRSWK